MLRRPRRNRRSAALRNLCAEHSLTVTDFVLPLFVVEGQGIRQEIQTMPGVFRYSADRILKVCEQAVELGIQAVCLFPKVSEADKTPLAEFSYRQDNFYLQTVTAIKKRFPDLLVMSDVAMDPYSSDGHDGVVSNGHILNDETLPILGQMAVAQAAAGADIIGPSDMMDGRIRYIRDQLDAQGFTETAVLSYAVKYASAFYGPFRDALGSAPKSGDKKTYQMNLTNRREALLEAETDIAEGADILMVKPGLAYLDIIYEMKTNVHLPVAAYNVSGEYAALKFGALNGALSYKEAVLETLTAFKRAGADFILSYHSLEACDWLKNNRL